MANETKGYENSNINWYPGHMTSARRMMEENIKLIDIVIEILDARIPYSSRNPDIDNLARNKFRLVILNKKDMADNKVTESWIRYYKEKGITCLALDARNRSSVSKIMTTVSEVCKEKIERDRKKGIQNRPIKAMIVGIPNSGKSTFINSFAGKTYAKTGNKPGVTRGKQWIRAGKGMELLDTPGILWPKFEDQNVGINLAITGAINDNILDMGEISYSLIKYMQNNYCQVLTERYKISDGMGADEAFSSIAEVRKCMKKGGEPDYDRAARIVIDDFRSLKLGNVSLERPEDIGE